MNRNYYQLSPYVQIIRDLKSGDAMVYHSLFGNPRVLNGAGLIFLDLFKEPVDLADVIQVCDEDPDGVVRELAEISFLIKPGFDEREHLRVLKERHLGDVTKGKTIDRMGLAISDVCNFGCKHCMHFQPDTDNDSVLPLYKKPKGQLNMSWSTAKQCVDRYIDLMRKQGRTIGKIHFGNAEPLINWPVIAKVLNYCGSFDDLSFEFAINTNLALMTEEMAKILKHFRVRIATSLDGTEQSNDVNRTTKLGHGTFKSVLGKFDLLNDVGYPLDGFSITVTSRNYDIIGTDIIDLAFERGMKSIAFDYDLVGLVGVPVSLRVAKLMEFKRYANARGIDFFGTWDSVFRNLTSESLLFGNHAFCAAVEGRSLEFNVDGSIKVCSHATTKVGHLNSFEQMFQKTGGLYNMVRERFPGHDKYCFGCVFEGPCGGQCHVTREVASRPAEGTNRQLVFADMCDFYRKVTETLALDYIQTSGGVTCGNRNCGCKL